MVAVKFAALAAVSAPLVSAINFQGFNSGNTFLSGAAKNQQDFTKEFNAAKAMPGLNGQFNSFRLYTMIQAGTQNSPLSAIPAAIDTQTNLLLGLWGSAGQANVDNEIAALKSAISTYGDKFAQRVIGISVGSEDLYRISPTGIKNKAGVGAGPAEITRYINQVKDALRGTPLSGKPVGHVDTWTAWVNGTNNDVIVASDFLGVNAFPYYQTESGDNSVKNGPKLFFEAYQNTIGAAKGKDVWVTETGWPNVGPAVGQAEANSDNAQSYYNEVACKLIGKTNFFYYTLQDANPQPAQFGIDNNLSGKPNIDLSCKNAATSSTAVSSAAPTSLKAGPTTVVVGGGATSARGPSADGPGVTIQTSIPATVTSRPTVSVLPGNPGAAPTSTIVGGGNGTAPTGPAASGPASTGSPYRGAASSVSAMASNSLFGLIAAAAFGLFL